MTRLSAREAIKYAFSREMLELYVLILLADIFALTGGWIGSNWAVRGGTAGLIGQVIGTILFLGGIVTGIGAFVGFIYKILVDANRRTK